MIRRNNAATRAGYGSPSERPKPHKPPTPSNTWEYGPWIHMISRCQNPKDDYFASYGGRGTADMLRRAQAAGIDWIHDTSPDRMTTPARSFGPGAILASQMKGESNA